MRDLLTPLRVIRASSANAWADLWVMYSPTSWTVGWLSRVLMQVVFFAMIGLLLDVPGAVRFLFIGNAVMITVMEVLFSIASTGWERSQGTLPLLIASPSRLWPVFIGRSVQWLPSGILTASVALFVLGPAFGITWSPGRAVAAFGVLIVVAVSTYCFGLTLGAVTLAAMRLRIVVVNLIHPLMILLGGVMVPMTFWPTWIQVIGQALPLTHGLAAIRSLADAPSGASVAG